MALAHAILVAHNCVEIVQGAASCYTVGDAQTNHDNQLRRHNDPFAQFGSCNYPKPLRNIVKNLANTQTMSLSRESQHKASIPQPASCIPL